MSVWCWLLATHGGRDWHCQIAKMDNILVMMCDVALETLGRYGIQWVGGLCKYLWELKRIQFSSSQLYLRSCLRSAARRQSLSTWSPEDGGSAELFQCWTSVYDAGPALKQRCCSQNNRLRDDANSFLHMHLIYYINCYLLLTMAL